METNGFNIGEGVVQFVEDLINPKIHFQNDFAVGENIAATPGVVVFKNEIMELIRYKPAGKKIFNIPLLIIPPWINKYYIFDLRQENSFVKFLVEQGVDVYIISWVNPQIGHGNIAFEDYMLQGIMEAQKFILSSSGAKELNFLGYCIGGILLSCYLAYAAKKKLPGIKSGSFLATPLDFEKVGDLKLFVTSKQLDFLQESTGNQGILSGHVLYQFFNLLKSKEMIWDPFVNQYMLGNAPRPLDFLFWNSDVANLPAKMYDFYIRTFYLGNGFFKQKGIPIHDVLVKLNQINVETFWLSTKEDHIAPHESTLSGLNLLKSPFEFVLGGSGHVAGILNPATSNKYGFNAGGVDYEGSWWPYWSKWLLKRSGDFIKPYSVKGLYPSPGKYVK